MKDWRVWALLIGLYLVIRMCGGCNGCSGGRLDLSETNTLELVPDDNSTFSELTVTLYPDKSTHVEGAFRFSGKRFSDDTYWELIDGTYHDTKVKGIDIHIPAGPGTYRSVSYYTVTVTPNLDYYEGGFDNVKGGYERLQGFKPKGHFRVR